MKCPRCGEGFPVSRARSIPSDRPEVGRVKACRKCGHFGVVRRDLKLGKLPQDLNFPDVIRGTAGLTSFDLEVYSDLYLVAVCQNITYDPAELANPKPLTSSLTSDFTVDHFRCSALPEGTPARRRRWAILRALAMLIRCGALEKTRVSKTRERTIWSLKLARYRHPA
ncbi:hypothetical protein [Singulisphaera sp. PoT]|uniref:hypothetical protein n=1 Tax=Singulisphaera sp. PoT TaxID=3411797 RepID=UPI003BF61655